MSETTFVFRARVNDLSKRDHGTDAGRSVSLSGSRQDGTTVQEGIVNTSCSFMALGEAGKGIDFDYGDIVEVSIRRVANAEEDEAAQRAAKAAAEKVVAGAGAGTAAVPAR